MSIELPKELSEEQRAFKKLDSEMNQNKSNAYVQSIGQFLKQHIEKHNNAAEAILATDKTIEKSLDLMKEEAKKKAVNGFAMFTPEEGFALVLNYFQIRVEQIEVPEPQIPVKKANRFDVKLDDFL
ncbi:Cas9 inhibitor AcrIIA9 family protein [Lederbergia lenta]|uniref:Cas9 inhibitor AcrIIA9 family protein n=1 Tax=Lederbergia lenta TaxID=1467 RepID=UPI00203B7FC0|nr:Cas9 inhibitor AcrIIA9 family protein [Lederbergia lenta]MCM3113623.1 Cas9 inhibitor AcrIIA9 family protein [Lederbergia lenta]